MMLFDEGQELNGAFWFGVLLIILSVVLQTALSRRAEATICGKWYLQIVRQPIRIYYRQKKQTPLCRVFTNENGQVKENITLPAHAKQVYLYANGFGIPTILKSTIENGHITIDATQTAQTRAAQPAMTRAANAEKQYKVWTVDETNKLNCHQITWRPRHPL